MKRYSKFIKGLCVFTALTLVLSCVPLFASAASSTITFSVFSDMHYLADNLYDYNSPAWQVYLRTTHRQMELANSILDNAFDLSEHYLEEAKRNNSAFVLIPGDITKDGEYESHKQMAEKFAAFEAETDIPVFVVPGNHDIRNSNATDYTGEKAVPARITEPTDFEILYKDFGYDESDPGCVSRFKPAAGNYGGYLSYSWKLNDDYMLIAVDSNKYSADNGSEKNEHLTDGMIGDDLMDWIKEQAQYANDNGLQIILMQHHNLVQHMDIEEATFFAFVIDNWEYVCDTYADAGIHYAFTGHLHSHDTASYVNDNGERITDLLSSTITGYPNMMRIAEFTYSDGDFSMNMVSHDIDELTPLSYERNGETITYEQPFKYTNSYDMTFGETIEDFAYSAVDGLVESYFPQIQAAGGLLGFLKEKNIDLEKIIVDALGTNGLALGDVEILTVSQNLMGLIKDIGKQIDERYINDPDYCLEFVRTILHKLLSFELSDKPCTLFYEQSGHGNATGPTTLDDFGQMMLLAYYGGDEIGEDDPMVQDVLAKFESGELAKEFFALLRETVVEDLVKNEILANIDFNPGELFPDGTLLALTGDILQAVSTALLGGDNSLLNLVNSVLGIALVPDKYSSLDNILDTLIGDEFFVDSQFQAWGHTISWMVSTLVIDHNPMRQADGSYAITYSGPEDVEATVENYRLPSNIAITMSGSPVGADITWLTKYSVTGTDIQIVNYSENPDFENGTEYGIDSVSSHTDSTFISYPGADLGIIAFLDFEKEYTRHCVTVNFTESGKYSYRVGDASRGWWSEPGVIEVDYDSDKAAFIAVADIQGQNPTHYGVVNDTFKAAFDTVPEANFIVSAGNQVTLAKNSHHWRDLLNVNSEFFSNKFFMPSSGSREKAGGYVAENFSLPATASDSETGVYYSYDYGNIHFTVINTNDVENKKLSAEQLEWIEEDISSSDAKWKIAVIPNAIYSNGAHSGDKDVKGVRAQLSPLLSRLGVDLVLQGRECVYWRSGAISGGVEISAKEKTVSYNGLDYTAKINPQGTVYVVPGSGGVKRSHAEKEDSSFPDAEVKFTPDAPMFVSVRTDGDMLYFDAYTVKDGKAERVDNFAIEKNSEAANDAASLLGRLVSFIANRLNISWLWRLIAVIRKVFSFAF